MQYTESNFNDSHMTKVLIHNGIIVLSLKNNCYITSDKPANIISVCLFFMKINVTMKINNILKAPSFWPHSLGG